MDMRTQFVQRLINVSTEQKQRQQAEYEDALARVNHIAEQRARAQKTIMITGDEEMAMLDEMRQKAQIHNVAWYVLKREIHDPERLRHILQEIIVRIPAEAAQKSGSTELGIPVKWTTKAMQAIQKAADKPRRIVLGIPVRD